MFLNPRIKVDTWKMACWFVRVQRSLIMKSGTESDKVRLPEQGRWNTARNLNLRTSIDGYLAKSRRTRKHAHLTQQLPQVPTPLHIPMTAPPSTPPPTPPPTPYPVLRPRPPPQHQLMRSPVVYR